MDPVTAIGLVGTILTFVEHGTKVVLHARQIYQSAAGLTDDARRQEAEIASLKDLCSRLSEQTLPWLDKPEGLDKELASLLTLARECEELSGQLSKLIADAKPKREKSMFSSVVAAWKQSGGQENRRLLLERQLDRCRRQSESSLGLFISRANLHLSKQIDHNVRQDSEKVAKLMTSTQELERAAQAGISISNDVQEQLKCLLDNQHRALSSIKQQKVLDALAFNGMNQREETVEIADPDTFRWFLRPEDEVGQPQSLENSTAGEESAIVDEKGRVRKLFVEWLTNGTGIFHFTGKLGSGKSTLLKFLSTNELTKELLEKWADGRQLTVIRFFFWKPGSDLQKSYLGLVRALLHGLLSSCPHLIAELSPRLMELQLLDGSERASTIDEEVFKLFSRAMTHPALYAKRCYCLFIDGLDEFEGTLQQDQKFMVEKLVEWTSLNPAIKICASSRPENVFMNTMDPRQRVKIHTLTKQDMKNYAHRQLGHMKDKKVKHRLVDAVVEKAEGIFLWVALVVKSLRAQLEDGAEPADLIESVNLLPDELDGLFRHILKTLKKPAKGYRTLAMVQLGMKYNMPLSLFAYSFFDNYERKSPNLEIDLEQDSREERINRASKKLQAYCGGLVEDVPNAEFSKHFQIDDYFYLALTHRSITEFLAADDIQQEMGRRLSGFDVADAISNLFFLALKNEELLRAKHGLVHQYKALFEIRHEAGMDYAPYQFWESVDAIHANRFFDCSKLGQLRVAFISTRVHDARSLGDMQDESYTNIIHKYDSSRLLPPVYVALDTGWQDYPIWKVRNDMSLTDCNYKIGFLLSTYASTDDYLLVPTLLEMGIISPETYLPWDIHLEPLGEPLTICEEVLGRLTAFGFLNGLSRVPMISIRAMVAVLEHGGDPSCKVTTMPTNLGICAWLAFPSRIIDGKAKLVPCYRIQQREIVGILSRVEKHETWSLRGWVTNWDNEPDDGGSDMAEKLALKERVLELIDLNMRKLGQLPEEGTSQAQDGAGSLPDSDTTDAALTPSPIASSLSAETTPAATPSESPRQEDTEAAPSPQSEPTPSHAAPDKLETSLLPEAEPDITTIETSQQHNVLPDQNEQKPSQLTASPAFSNTIPAFLLGILLTILVQYLLQRPTAQPPTSQQSSVLPPK